MSAVKTILIQASSTSWSGGRDLCMNLLEGEPILLKTMRLIFDQFSDIVDNIKIIAPEFDRGGLDFLEGYFPAHFVTLYYGNNESPLLRMIGATSDADDSDIVLRLNGLNFCVDADCARKNLAIARKTGCDCIRFPDDFPALFTSDVYKIGALRRMADKAENIDKIYHIHPKYYMSKKNGFESLFSDPDLSKYSDQTLSDVRRYVQDAIYTKRVEVDPSRSIKSGDTISLHYDMALPYIKNLGVVLDLACGSGFGSNILASAARTVVGIDNDNEVIEQAMAAYGNGVVSFRNGNVFNLPFAAASVDAAVAFEIIEHVDPAPFLREVRRVLKPGGILCLSTPQNSLGHIPSTPDHLREFSLREISELINEFFIIENITGIKQGCIYFENDPIGSNTFVVAKAPGV